MTTSKNTVKSNNRTSQGVLSRRGFVKIGICSSCVVGLGLVVDATGLNMLGSKAYAEELLFAENSEAEGTFVPDETLNEEDNCGDVPTTFAANGNATVNEIQGATRYETAVKEALTAFSSSTWALVASGGSYADSLAAGALAGALNCPILLSDSKNVPSSTLDALNTLGVSNVILLGGTDVLSANVESQLKKVANTIRLAGPTRYETQMEIFEYGDQKGYWTGNTVIVATGNDFADALASSPLSFELKAPVFFCDASGSLPEIQKTALESFSSAQNFIIIGGTKAITTSTEQYLSSLSKQRGGAVVRLGGETRYETSAKIASYAVSNLGFQWDGLAFASGTLPYDALAGGPLQGKQQSVLLLADSRSDVSANSVPSTPSSISFLGGYNAIPIGPRVEVCTKLGITSYQNVSTTKYAITLDRMARLEANSDGANGVTYNEFVSMLDPNAYQYGTSQYYQFAILTDGYSGLTASQLDAYIANNCSYSESNYGRTSGLRGRGADFVEAAKTYGVNEAYLISHAIWESGWGCSELAAGWKADKDGVAVINGGSYPYKKGTTYYNFYGIGAYDSNALSSGRAMAVKQGWTSPRLAILGAAKWISENYLRRSSGAQNTLYLMKFDVPGAVNSGSVWHQYCTGGNSWVLGIARVTANCYSSAGIGFDKTPVKFNVPIYS